MIDIQEKFNAIAADYDKQRPMFIPGFYDFYGIAIKNLELKDKCPLVLDLGAGTGLFSSFVNQKYPLVKLTLVDISQKMLDVAKDRFSEKEDITFVCSDISSFSSNLKYDAVVSSLAIHHLDDAQKIAIYNKIYSLLKDDGLFIHAEQVEGETPYMKELNQTRWEESVENSGLSQSEIRAGYERVNLDKRVPLSQQLEWLKEAGFSEVDCIYKYYDFTVIYCKK